MEDKYCMYCGKPLTEKDRLQGCCNRCAEKQIKYLKWSFPDSL